METERKNNPGGGASKARRALRLCLAFLLVCALALAAVTAVQGLRLKEDLKASGRDVSDHIKGVAAGIRQQDAAETEAQTAALEADAARIEELLDSRTGRLATRWPGFRAEMAVLQRLPALLNETTEQLLRPYTALMREHPLSELRKENGGIDLAVAESYLGFVSGRSDELLHLSGELEELSAMPWGRLEDYVADKRDDIGRVAELVPFALEVTEELLKPGTELLRDCPLSAIKAENRGINTEVIERYLRFAEEKVPYARAVLEKLDALALEPLESSDSYRKAREKADALLRLYDETLPYQPLLRAFLGGGEDRLYVFAAQNSAEIRASGGFPGAVGTVRIQNGVLRIEDFQPVNTVLSYYKTADTVITPTEKKLFGDWFSAPRDADFCPDFERVAEIWASAYEDKVGEHVDGVLSATPVIIQRLLSVIGEVKLSDGTVLDGTNAARVLEYDIYYRFFKYGSNSGIANDRSDALFAETAAKVMEEALKAIEPARMGDYLSVVKESAADRTLMLWLKDTDAQELVRSAGLACSLNADASKPEAGIYFSLTNPSRMGWFLDMDPTVELLEEHEDGSKTYAVHLEMRNIITQEEIMNASRYITGSGIRGTVTGYLYLFAPAGGTIGEVKCTDRRALFTPEQYHGLELRYTHQIQIGPEESLSIDYTVTTAAGEQEALALSMTPTLQAYR